MFWSLSDNSYSNTDHVVLMIDGVVVSGIEPR
jgi:hypothetical protein